MIRRLRANLLDELQKQYVVTAKAKGLHPLRALVKYPLRMSLNFFVSDIGSILPTVISGAELTAIVLSLPTTGPLLVEALQSRDMYLAGSFLMFLALLTVIGVLISDLALAILDPRIRLRAAIRSDHWQCREQADTLLILLYKIMGGPILSPGESSEGEIPVGNH